MNPIQCLDIILNCLVAIFHFSIKQRSSLHKFHAVEFRGADLVSHFDFLINAKGNKPIGAHRW